MLNKSSVHHLQIRERRNRASARAPGPHPTACSLSGSQGLPPRWVQVTSLGAGHLAHCPSLHQETHQEQRTARIQMLANPQEFLKSSRDYYNHPCPPNPGELSRLAGRPVGRERRRNQVTLSSCLPRSIAQLSLLATPPPHRGWHQKAPVVECVFPSTCVPTN